MQNSLWYGQVRTRFLAHLLYTLTSTVVVESEHGARVRLHVVHNLAWQANRGQGSDFRLHPMRRTHRPGKSNTESKSRTQSMFTVKFPGF